MNDYTSTFTSGVEGTITVGGAGVDIPGPGSPFTIDDLTGNGPAVLSGSLLCP